MCAERGREFVGIARYPEFLAARLRALQQGNGIDERAVCVAGNAVAAARW
jgi:hypothetical protein